MRRSLCTLAFLVTASQAVGAEPLLDRLLIIAPAAPGGGWDQTARAMQHALQHEGLVRVVEVQNVAGAAGTIGLAQFVDAHHEDASAVLVTGLVMLAATIWNQSPVSLAQAAPIARLTGEYEVIAVPAASPHRSMRELVSAFRASPEHVAWGGGSAGGTDHILAGLVALAAGIDPRRVNYIAFSGGGEAVAALVGGNVTAGISGYSEFAPHIASGRLRALGLSASSRVSAVDVPTLREQGLDVEITNWRGIVGAPGIDAEARERIAAVIRLMAQSATWRRTCVARGWIDAYQDDQTFGQFLASERLRIGRIVARLRGPDQHAGRVAQRVIPMFVLSGAATVVVLMFMRRRVTSAGQSEPGNWRAIATLSSGLLAFLVLLEPLGFIVAATLLFTCVAAAMAAAPRRVLQTLSLALLFSTIVYVAFTRGLDLTLPAGAVWSWIH